MDCSLNEQSLTLNLTSNLISCLASAYFFGAFYKTPRKPTPLKMIFALLSADILRSLLRIMYPYITTNSFNCALVREASSFLALFSIILAIWMCVLSVRSMKLGFPALTPEFFWKSVTISAISSAILCLLPYIAPQYFQPPAHGSSTKATHEFFLAIYNLFPMLALMVSTVVCKMLISCEKPNSNTLLFPAGFQVNIQRLMWYPVGKMIICAPMLIGGFSRNTEFDDDWNSPSMLQEIFFGLSGFVVTSIYIAQRILIHKEERLMNADLVSLTLSERMTEQYDLSEAGFSPLRKYSNYS